jgi:ubiquitin-small subunit ribosomal protein S27Ae
MADKKPGAPKKGTSAGLQKLYMIKDGQLIRTRQACPKCGPGIFMAHHKDRVSCGHCGHTEFKKGQAS